MGIRKDIGLVNDDYQWLGSMFYFGMFLPFDTVSLSSMTDTLQATSPGNIQQVDSSSAFLSPSTPPSVS